MQLLLMAVFAAVVVVVLRSVVSRVRGDVVVS